MSLVERQLMGCPKPRAIQMWICRIQKLIALELWGDFSYEPSRAAAGGRDGTWKAIKSHITHIYSLADR